VLTNFRFGQMDNFYGLDGFAENWPSGAVMIGVMSSRTDLASVSSDTAPLRIRAGDFQVSPELKAEGMFSAPLAETWRFSNNHQLTAFVEVRSVTPATVAKANEILASVRGCSASARSPSIR